MGAIKTHLGAIITQLGAIETYLGAIKTHLGGVCYNFKKKTQSSQVLSYCSHACDTSSQLLHPIWYHQNSIWEECVKIWEQSKHTWEHTVKSWEQPKHTWEHPIIICLTSSIYEEDLHTYPRNM